MLGSLFSVLGLCLAGMATPGPDTFLVLRLASRSRAHAVAAALGIASALIVWTGLSVSGAAIVLRTYPSTLLAIQLLGSAWLAYMAYSLVQAARAAWRERARRKDGDGQEAQGWTDLATLPTLRGAYGQGVLTNLSNPKAVLFFAAIIAPIMPLGSPWWVGVLYAGSIVALSAVFFSSLALGVSTQVVRRRLLAAGPLIDACAAALFTAVAVALLVEAARSVI
ncbi:hypothetical protein DLJ54_01975 [Corynebacterium heidelbergense]|uniref:Lysine transporter LysE n=2 Tax=Corynebacterium heidelbergense TaxID=2055947 RepID=A0A364V863_9CORY|nr:hypothetical protein DLJ54_01975 [Corynebacterium heidelbergense]